MVLVTFTYRAQQRLAPQIVDRIRHAFTSNEGVLSKILAGLKPVNFRVSIPPDGRPLEEHPSWPVDVLVKDQYDIDKPVACLHLFQHDFTFSTRMQPRVVAVEYYNQGVRLVEARRRYEQSVQELEEARRIAKQSWDDYINE
ncbi:hypothetical protein C0992_002087 [Termitomyces sp. T32_za158]|nr:hypothetical protein C0992_002087 [Termitomyces sp. T32_za158]